ncbi:hypothetical protein JG687_00018583 [Phytophthora cactorum]|uniref:RXLR phytopathogen effector protein WY-domain domain-containing protein n=1 Tax=Phytophthora cactorum TaxID=29920 RepID=A0A329SI61_9STRA|nr:hypothetical protein GQ600_733 [Phytophthora cactorum]KAG2789535.1 hypothetical protein Pcac1_g869 [Phytophthora cactorum]KAG2793250.1 hypothetical protein PC111_g23113 [Phytophthora cactorum]KAG2793585.1 hypothetical protein PC112_g23382 [Phytophthora cactorum]KAG2815399.1 hypothetical protein PC113_g23210 [Phytophthora cactorum]
MGFQKTMLLAVAFFVGSFAQPDQAYGPEMTAPYVPNSLSTSTIAPSSRRFLRSYDTAAWDTVDSEEKAGASLLSKVDDLMQKIFKSRSPVEEVNMKAFLQFRGNLFGGLRLGNGAATLGDNPKFVKWFKLVMEYRAKYGEQAFSDLEIHFLLLKTNSPEQLKTLLESLQKTPGLQKISKSMKNWLKSPQSPENVFDDLRLATAKMDGLDDNSVLIQWFRYIEVYKDITKKNVFSDVEILNFLRKAKPRQSEWELAARFQSLKEVPDLKSLAGNMQTNLYQKWFSSKVSPNLVSKWLGAPSSVSPTLLKTDPSYQTWEAYTLYYAEQIGGTSVMENVKKYLASTDPIKIDGLTAVMKAE